jgi:hypothetical protein
LCQGPQVGARWPSLGENVRLAFVYHYSFVFLFELPDSCQTTYSLFTCDSRESQFRPQLVTDSIYDITGLIDSRDLATEAIVESGRRIPSQVIAYETRSRSMMLCCVRRLLTPSHIGARRCNTLAEVP